MLRSSCYAPRALLLVLCSYSQSKWASSSGPTHVSKITSSLPDSVKTRASSLTSTYFNMRYFRSPKVYLGMGEGATTPSSARPKNKDQI